LGAIAGTILPKDLYEVNSFNKAADEVRTEFNTAQQSGWAGSRDPRAFDKPESIFTPRETTAEPIRATENPPVTEKKTGMGEEGSIGAAQVNPTDKPSVSGSTEQLMEDSKNYLRGTDWVNKTEFRETPAGNAAKMFYDQMVKTPFASDWDKLANSDSTIAQAMAHKIFESASGIVRNNRSAAMLKDYYENNLLDVNRAYATHFDSYAKEQNQSFTDPSYHFELPQKFDSDVMQEMNSRYHDYQSHPSSSQSVKNMADTIDHYSSKAVDYLKGKEGETPVAGSETMEQKSGWMPQKWRGENMRQIIKDYPNGEKNIAQGIANSYQRTYNMTPEDALVYAKAVVRGSLAREDGIGTNLIQLLRTDGKATFEKFLTDNGYPQSKIDPLIQKLLGHIEQSGQESFTKARLDVDLREKIPGTDKTIQDLVDNNVRKIWSKYSRQASGSAALARHGIQRADKQGIINAIKQEVAAKGDTSIPTDLINNLFSHFESGPVGGGLNRATIMATRLSDLAVLNSLGLTKMSEVGAMIGAVGIKAFKDTAPAEVKAMLSGEKTPIVKELEKLTGPIGDTETLHNDSFTFEEMKKDANVASELLHYTEQMLGKGKRLQGFVSGFYHVHTLQQRVAVTSMVQKLDTMLKGELNDAKVRRLYDMGMDKDLTARVADNFNKLASHDEDGKLTSLNLDKWEPKDVEDFRLALNRHTYQTLQRSMAGEGSMWWHSDFGSLFTHLKQFTLGSIQKQVLRNMALSDPEAMASVTYGLMTAAAAYTAQRIVHGQSDQITPTKVMKGAIGLSNFTTFIPAMVDPVFSMLGMENAKFDHYGQTDISTGIIPTPVVVPSLNRLLHIPGALFGLATGHYTKGDVHALQAMPLIGNAPGIGAIWNEMYTPPPKGHHKK
ncbi:MAG TPA: hypothetical protein VNZ45_15915, partial [Bacteroidia bacterium]|nr:hypothetical protein [Bacteroidia bacterium]